MLGRLQKKIDISIAKSLDRGSTLTN
jgi:hypothetical protein